jgi:SAM-dependent methyltransferase
MTGAKQQTGVTTATTKHPGGKLGFTFYRFAYRHGRPRWDSAGPHPELEALVADRRPGRALDLGCGTGSDAVYLAAQGWDVVGVDFVPEAIDAARTRAIDAGSSPTFVVGDVTRLREAGVVGPFDLIVDTGCYHGIPAGRRDDYATEVGAVAGPGADFYLAGISDPPVTWRLLGARGVDADDLRRRFGADFDLVDERAGGKRGRASHFVLYHLVRRPGVSGR